MAAPALLNNVDHHDLRVRVGHGAAYGDAVATSLVFPTEFEAVQRDYPIFFRKDAGGAFQAVALLGLEAGENLFLDGDRWDARYVPAFHQRGPFSIGLQRGSDGAAYGAPMIQVDVDHPRVSRTEGEPVFLPNGGNAPLLEGIAAALRTLYAGVDASRAMFDAFTRLDLIEPVTVEVRLGEHEQIDFTQFHTIGAERFARLDGDALAALNAADLLRPAVWAMSSLGNVQHLIARKLERTSA